MGPMPPLHDVCVQFKYPEFISYMFICLCLSFKKASQNGHFEVIKLLLKAGALVYSFDHDVIYFFVEKFSVLNLYIVQFFATFQRATHLQITYATTRKPTWTTSPKQQTQTWSCSRNATIKCYAQSEVCIYKNGGGTLFDEDNFTFLGQNFSKECQT